MSIYAKIRDGKDSATEADLTTIQSDFLSDDGGIVDVSGGDCEVTEKGTPDMSVDVAAGSGYIPLAAWSQNSREQKIGAFNNTDTVNVSISSNASGNDRIDIVCAKWDTGASPDDDGSNVVTFAVTEGTPAASPVAPATPNNQYKLAEVLVSNGTSSITNSDITDSRTPVKLAQAGQDMMHVDSDNVLQVGDGVNDVQLNGGVLQDVISGLQEVTITASGTADVSGKSVIIINTSGGSVNLTGTTNAVAGQVVHVYKSSSSNTGQVLHNSAGQVIFTPGAATITWTAGNYGGCVMVFDGTRWRVVSETN